MDGDSQTVIYLLHHVAFILPRSLFILNVKNHSMSMTGGLAFRQTFVIIPTEALSIGLKYRFWICPSRMRSAL